MQQYVEWTICLLNGSYACLQCNWGIGWNLEVFHTPVRWQQWFLWVTAWIDPVCLSWRSGGLSCTRFDLMGSKWCAWLGSSCWANQQLSIIQHHREGLRKRKNVRTRRRGVRPSKIFRRLTMSLYHIFKRIIVITFLEKKHKQNIQKRTDG